MTDAKEVIGQMKKGLYNQSEDKILRLPDQQTENKTENNDKEYKANL